MNSIIIFGLGNPGCEYKYTKHNIGHIILNYIAHKLNIAFQKKDTTSANIVSYKLNENKIILVKSLEYMNNSGISASKICNYYKISTENMLVVHDDLDINFGQAKAQFAGSNAGHNGIKSIDSAVGKNYYRIRLGISRPNSHLPDAVAKYVLSNFSKQEIETICITANAFWENISTADKLELQNLKVIVNNITSTLCN